MDVVDVLDEVDEVNVLISITTPNSWSILIYLKVDLQLSSMVFKVKAGVNSSLPKAVEFPHETI